jgi:hypothetical protein
VLWILQGQPTCADCEKLAEEEKEAYTPSCQDPKKDYECYSNYWDYGRLFPENELAWTVYQQIKLLGPGAIELIGLKEELGPMEMERLIERLMIIEDTVNRYNEANNKPEKPKKTKK